MKYLINQAAFLPVFYFIPIFIAGFLTKDYNIISQHSSEISISEFQNAKIFFSLGMFLTGLSFVLLSVGLIIKYKHTVLLTSILLSIFGISMISNGIYPMGSPMHGIYGIGFVIMILPFVTCYEVKDLIFNKIFFRISLISGLLIFIYFWLMIVQLDPSEYKGLTQRVAGVIIFGWTSYLAIELKKTVKRSKK